MNMLLCHNIDESHNLQYNSLPEWNIFKLLCFYYLRYIQKKVREHEKKFAGKIDCHGRQLNWLKPNKDKIYDKFIHRNSFDF